uniref:Uncharacterized protein n=1 Tax=Globodera rostochiensis TaxID=31243 RepID=A0A914H830_GLORO
MKLQQQKNTGQLPNHDHVISSQIPSTFFWLLRALGLACRLTSGRGRRCGVTRPRRLWPFPSSAAYLRSSSWSLLFSSAYFLLSVFIVLLFIIPPPAYKSDTSPSTMSSIAQFDQHPFAGQAYNYVGEFTSKSSNEQMDVCSYFVGESEGADGHQQQQEPSVAVTLEKSENALGVVTMSSIAQFDQHPFYGPGWYSGKQHTAFNVNEFTSYRPVVGVGLEESENPVVEDAENRQQQDGTNGTEDQQQDGANGTEDQQQEPGVSAAPSHDTNGLPLREAIDKRCPTLGQFGPFCASAVPTLRRVHSLRNANSVVKFTQLFKQFNEREEQLNNFFGASCDAAQYWGPNIRKQFNFSTAAQEDEEQTKLEELKHLPEKIKQFELELKGMKEQNALQQEKVVKLELYQKEQQLNIVQKAVATLCERCLGFSTLIDIDTGGFRQGCSSTLNQN